MNIVRPLPLSSFDPASPRVDIDVAGFVRVLGLRPQRYPTHRFPAALIVLCDERPTVHRLRIRWVPLDGVPEDLDGLAYLGEEAGGVLFLHPVERHPPGWRAEPGTEIKL